MQKNAFSYVLGVAALSLLCSCGANKKEEVKVPVEQAPTTEQLPVEANKEVALADQQPSGAAEANTTVAQADVPPVESNATKASEENKVA